MNLFGARNDRRHTNTEISMIDVHALPCICCKIEGANQASRTEAHHIVDKGYRKHSGGDESRLPLCEWHHRGICLDTKTTSVMISEYGPSLALTKKSFVATYGTERELLARLEAGI